MTEKSMYETKIERTISDHDLIRQITIETNKHNIDNISRTNAYFEFFMNYPEIKWAFLASMVSRNAGWNMCDLEGRWFPSVLKKQVRKELFLTYERANWLIFKDAFPQLLLYHYSTKMNRSMFHLCHFFQISTFMQYEWITFWKEKNEYRLMQALIINEQNVIQKPVIKHPVYRRLVFHSILFSFQDWLHFSSVLFPTCSGQLYGASVNGFRNVTKRIDLGKRLADILFAPELYPLFLQFAKSTPHTGSRYDYEQHFIQPKEKDTPSLRETFPVIENRLDEFSDWFQNGRLKKKWLNPHIQHRHPILITDWYLKKQKQLHRLIALKNLFLQ
jgi:hypothetical protein